MCEKTVCVSVTVIPCVLYCFELRSAEELGCFVALDKITQAFLE